jgi:two-component system chemotaxis response regulator CheY
MTTRKIMIIEDSILLHKMYGLILMRYTQAGATLLHAFDGIEGLDLLRKNPDVHLVILDTTLPRMNGFEFLQVCKSDHVLKDIPVLVVTTEGKEEHIHKGLEAGAYGYVTKPFQPNQLHQLIQTIFQVRDAIHG